MDPAGSRSVPGPTRTGVVGLTALLTQIVIIAAIGNQWVTDRIFDSILRDNTDFSRDFKQALIVFNWRFAPQHADQHSWLSQVLFIATLLVLSTILIRVVARGPVSFGRILVATWMSIIAATMFGAYVRGFVTDAPGAQGSRITRAMFGVYGPNTVTFLAGVLLGLVTGVVTASIALATRRPATAGPAAGSTAEAGDSAEPPEQPPPFFDTPTRPWQDHHHGPSGRHSAAPTTRLPEVPSSPPGGDAATTRFPRPPDDDELGHVPS